MEKAHTERKCFSRCSGDLLARIAPLTAVIGCPGIFAHQALDPFASWEALEIEAGCEREVPFWSIVWPASIVLARIILQGILCVKNQSVLEIGCGAAIAAIAAAKTGASRVVANDTDTEALEIAQRNACANGVSIAVDTGDYLVEQYVMPADIILVADMFYQKKQAALLAELLLRERAHGRRVIIADAERSFAPRCGFKEIAAEMVAVNPDVEGTAARRVRVIELFD